MKVVIDEDTLELKEIEDDISEEEITDFNNKLHETLDCEPEDFYKKYLDYKRAEANFKQIYEPFKQKLIKLHEDCADLPNGVVIGGMKLIYVSPSKRSSLDSKKLKEEEPELVKKYTKTTDVAATIRIEEV
jgi:predicted phage-related endonuclease